MAPVQRLRAAVDRRLKELLDAIGVNRWFLEDAKGQHELDHGMLLALHHQVMVALPEAIASLAATVDDVNAELRAASTRDGEHKDQLARLHVDVEDVRIRLRAVGSTTASLADQLATLDVPEPEPTLRVSVVVVTRDRADVVANALASVREQTYANWECLIVDDGSTDATSEAVEPFLVDPRFRYLRQSSSGAPAARNTALRQAVGDLIAYLDSDNTFVASYLARVVDAFQKQPSAEWSVAGQIVLDDRAAHVRDQYQPLSGLAQHNFIDLNSLAHRRRLVDALWPLFDEELARLSDWALIRRLAGRSAPLRIPAVGVHYETRRADRITSALPFAPYALRVRRQGQEGTLAAGLRVLLAEWHFPQLTETYVRTELEALQAHGAEVEAWSQETELASPYLIDVAVHHGSLVETIEARRPDVVLTHWTNKAEEFHELVRGRVPLFVVRTHGFEFDAARIDRLLSDPAVVVHTFPHLVDPTWSTNDRLVVTPSSFNEGRFPPSDDKDCRFVLRTAAGIDTKDLEVFFETAKRCPDHRFVLVIGHAQRVEHQAEELVEQRNRRGSPCEVLVDVPHDKVAELMAQAGIYLHTHGTSAPMGMPISISEAMATGCFVIARDLPGAAGYLGGHGALYDGAEIEDRADAAAAIIRSTTEWSDAEWRRRWMETVDRAYDQFASTEVMASMLRSWKSAKPTLPIDAGS